MKEVRIKIDGEMRSFLVHDGLAELIKKLDIQEINQERRYRRPEIPLSALSRHKLNGMSLQRYQEDEAKEA